MVIASVQKSSIHLGFYIYYNIFQPSSFYDAHILWTIVVIFYSLTSVSFSILVSQRFILFIGLNLKRRLSYIYIGSLDCEFSFEHIIAVSQRFQ